MEAKDIDSLRKLFWESFSKNCDSVFFDLIQSCVAEIQHNCSCDCSYCLFKEI